ncbi:hypothetical protein ABK040_012077 [Willaertia magna]
MAEHEETNISLTKELILIVDFGSQYTQLIARKVRELCIYSEIHAYDKLNLDYFENLNKQSNHLLGVILSGSFASVHSENSPRLDEQVWNYLLTQNIPILGICFGAQLMAHLFGEKVISSQIREYGRATLLLNNNIKNNLFNQEEDNIKSFYNELLSIEENIELNGSQIWMSHGDSIFIQEEGNNSKLEVIATTDSIPVAGYQVKGRPIYGVQFHPETYHSSGGKKILLNFLIHCCKAKCNWTASHFIDETVQKLKEIIPQDEKVVMALSGGVDSTVAAVLLHRAIGDRLSCIFVDNGLLRFNEFEQVLDTYKNFLHLNVKGVDAKELFYKVLDGVSDPEQKRKLIGKTFIDVFDEEAKKIEGKVTYLGQGTIYPDVVESAKGYTIKSHHNVGGLPELMGLKVVEPLRLLFKDEVRKVGKELDIPKSILQRHPFPGPGLAIRCLGDITKEKIELLQKADAIYINLLKEFNLYDSVWQAGCILLPVKSVGVQGDERTYEYVLALRAVTSVDGMTADFVDFPHSFLSKVSNSIINQVKGINRVVYDISSKPPATIEWE